MHREQKNKNRPRLPASTGADVHPRHSTTETHAQTTRRASGLPVETVPMLQPADVAQIPQSRLPQHAHTTPARSADYQPPVARHPPVRSSRPPCRPGTGPASTHSTAHLSPTNSHHPRNHFAQHPSPSPAARQRLAQRPVQRPTPRLSAEPTKYRAQNATQKKLLLAARRRHRHQHHRTRHTRHQALM